jgi:hypothetical protein
MRFPVRPELTTASVVHGLNTDHARRCWTTLHRSQPTPSHLSIGVSLFRSTEPLLRDIVVGWQEQQQTLVAAEEGGAGHRSCGIAPGWLKQQLAVDAGKLLRFLH